MKHKATNGCARTDYYRLLFLYAKPKHFACGTVIRRQEFRYINMSFKEVYDCEVLITEIEISKKNLFGYLFRSS
jgi:hypothetical protein